MQPPNWTEFLQCCVCTNKFDSTIYVPISLTCGHTLCTKCLTKLKTRVCPYDKIPINPLTESLPKNYAILQLLEEKLPGVDEGRYPDLSAMGVANGDRTHYLSAMEAVDQVALFLQPLADQGIASAVTHLTRPMLKKLVCVVNCQMLETEGRARSVRAARSIADRTVTELLVMHQNNQQISTLLWTAVRNRGCQFLGPVMQEEALKLILMVLNSGKFMARKTIVLYVVQKLQQDFPQASKTSVGHVVQLLYRASCFNVEKREDDSSLMQLKEEFRLYELLRREHDSQIIRMAMEAGLRISPEQWSNFLYGDHKHKSEMQSIIDKLISQGAASSGLSELIVSVGRSQDPNNLSEMIIPHLEALLKIDITNNDKCTELASSWCEFSDSMHSLLGVLQGFSTFMQIQSGRFKTGLCPFLSKPDGCPKGDKCTYAHTEDEREHYRTLSKGNKVTKARTEPIKMGGSLPRQGSRGRNSGDLGPPRSDISSYSSGGGYQNSVPPPPRDHYLRQSSSLEESFDSGLPLGYSYTDEQLLLQSGFSTGHSPDASLQVLQQVPPPNAHPVQQSYTPVPYSVGYATRPAPHYHTGPVASPHHQQQVWYEEPRGVLTANQTLYSSQDQRADSGNHSGSKRYLPNGGRQYQTSLPQDNSAFYGHSYIGTTVNKPSIQDQLSNVRRMHELVNQSVELHSAQHQPTYAYDFPPTSGESNPVTTVANYPPQAHTYNNPSHSYDNLIEGEADWKQYPQSQGYHEQQQQQFEEEKTVPVSSDTSLAVSGDSGEYSSYPPRAQSGDGYLPYVSSPNQTVTTSPLPEQDVVGGVNITGGVVSESQSGSHLVYTESSSRDLNMQMANLSIGKSAGQFEDTSTETSYSSSSLSTHSGAISSTPKCSVDLGSGYDGTLPSSHSSYPVQSVYSTDPHYPPQTTGGYPHNTVGESLGTVTVNSRGNYPISSASRNSEDELRERILRLERELKEKDARIEKQQAHMRWSGPKAVQPPQQVVPRPLYSGGGSGMIGSPHHSGLIQQLNSYSGPVQYSPHATMQHQYSPHGTMQHPYSPHGSMREYQSASSTPGPAGTIQGGAPSYYNPQPTPQPGYTHHQWSAPLSAPSGGQYVSQIGSLQQPNLTSPYIQTQQTGGYVIQENADDGMIAAYLQALEQEKAAAASALTASGYPQVYSGPVNPGIAGYPVQPTPPPHRQQYPGAYKYTC